jgi:hypothetical protein
MVDFDEEVRRKSRLALIQVLNLNLRLMEAWRRVQTDLTGTALSSDATMILMAVIAIKTQRVTRTGELQGFEDLSKPLDTGTLRRCNLSSIAAATGLNRETVRRRVTELERLGFAARDVDGGVTIADGLLQQPEVLACIGRQVAAISKTVERMRSDGILI